MDTDMVMENLKMRKNLEMQNTPSLKIAQTQPGIYWNSSFPSIFATFLVLTNMNQKGVEHVGLVGAIAHLGAFYHS